MAFNAHAGSIAQKTTTGNQAYTGVGFQPKAIIFFMTGLGAVGSGATARMGVGIALSSSSRAAVNADDLDNLATTDTDRRHDNTKCIICVAGGTIVAAADLVSMDSDGFTLNWTTTDGGTRPVSYLALGGADLSVFLKQIQAPNATGNVAYTGVGFQPEAMLAISSVNNNAPPVTNNDAAIAIGITDGSLSRGTSYSADHNVGASTYKSGYDAVFLLGNDAAIASATTRQNATFVSFDSDGFTLSWNDSDATDYYWILCLRGVNFKTGSITQPAAPGTQAITGVGFQPSALFVFSGQKTALIDASTTQNYGLSIGVASGASARSVAWVGGVDAADPTVTDRAYATDQLVTLWTPATPTKIGEADLDSFDSDGFTLDWGTANGTQHLLAYLAIGDPGNVPDPVIAEFIFPDLSHASINTLTPLVAEFESELDFFGYPDPIVAEFEFPSFAGEVNAEIEPLIGEYVFPDLIHESINELDPIILEFVSDDISGSKNVDLTPHEGIFEFPDLIGSPNIPEPMVAVFVFPTLTHNVVGQPPLGNISFRPQGILPHAYIHNGRWPYQRICELVTAGNMDRSFILMETGQAMVRIARSDPFFAQVVGGRRLVIESPVQPDWVGPIYGLEESRISGYMEVRASGMAAFMDNKLTPQSLDIVRTVGSNNVHRTLITLMNARGHTGIYLAPTTPVSPIVKNLPLGGESVLEAHNDMHERTDYEWMLWSDVSSSQIKTYVEWLKRQGAQDSSLIPHLYEGVHFDVDSYKLDMSLIKQAVQVVSGFGDPMADRESAIRQNQTVGQRFNLGSVPELAQVVEDLPSGMRNETIQYAVNNPGASQASNMAKRALERPFRAGEKFGLTANTRVNWLTLQVGHYFYYHGSLGGGITRKVRILATQPNEYVDRLDMVVEANL